MLKLTATEAREIQVKNEEARQHLEEEQERERREIVRVRTEEAIEKFKNMPMCGMESNDGSPFHFAAEKWNVEIISFLTNEGFTVHDRPITTISHPGWENLAISWVKFVPGTLSEEYHKKGIQMVLDYVQEKFTTLSPTPVYRVEFRMWKDVIPTLQPIFESAGFKVVFSDVPHYIDYPCYLMNVFA